MFILNNTLNNNIALFKLFNNILFDLQKKLLYYTNYMINLAINVFLYDQNAKNIKDN